MRIKKVDDRIVLTEKEVADRWQISHRTLQNWRVKKKGPKYVRIAGWSVRYFLHDVVNYETSNKFLR